MSTSTQIIFSRAVKHHVQDAFVSLLDRIDEFNIGAVLIYNHKPHFWRKKELDFTGVQLSDILVESQKTEFTFNKETNVIFDDTSDSSQRTVDIDLDLDGEVKIAFVDIGGDVGGNAKKIVKLSVSLGSFHHVLSNMFDAITAKSFTVNTNHPIVREAIDKGKTLFVISSVYQTQKVDISVTREADIDAKAKENEGSDTVTTSTSSGATGTTTATTSKPESGLEKAVNGAENVVKDLATKGISMPKEDLSADAKAVTTGLSVTKREVPSNVGFSVLRIDIDKNGVLKPQATIGVPYHHKIHSSFADAFDHIDNSPSTENTGKSSTATDQKPSEDSMDKSSTDNKTVEPSANSKTSAEDSETNGKKEK